MADAQALAENTVLLKIAAEKQLFKDGLHSPIVAMHEDGWKVFDSTGKGVPHTLIGRGSTIAEAMEAAGHPLRIKFGVVGSNVVRGDEPICVARSRNMAQRIAAALNAYTPGRRGF